MEGPTTLMMKMSGLHSKRKKSKSKRPTMDTLKEEDEEGKSHRSRKVSREDGGRGKRGDGDQKRFFLNVTYKQFLKYHRLLKVNEDQFREEVSKDQDELERKYGMYLEESEPEDEVCEDDNTTFTTVTEREELSPQTTPQDNKKGTKQEPKQKHSPREKPEKSQLRLPKITKPRRSKSPDGLKTPPAITTTPSGESENEDPLITNDKTLMKMRKNLMETFLTDTKTMLPEIHQGSPDLVTRSADRPGSSSRRSRRGSRQDRDRGAFPNLSMTSISTGKKRRGSVEVDWETRKLSLQKWSEDYCQWIVMRDNKYSKQVERMRTFELARKKGEKKKVPTDVPITCQRWKYIPLPNEASPIRFAVTYSGSQNPKKNKGAPKKKKMSRAMQLLKKK